MNLLKPFKGGFIWYNNQYILVLDYIDGSSHSLFANYLYYDYAVNAR